MGKRDERFDTLLVALVALVAIVAICFMFFSFLLSESGGSVVEGHQDAETFGEPTGDAALPPPPPMPPPPPGT